MAELHDWFRDRLSNRQKNRILQRYPQKSGLTQLKAPSEQRDALLALRSILEEHIRDGRRAILYFAPHPFCLASEQHEACGFCTFPHEQYKSRAAVAAATKHSLREAELYANVMCRLPADAVYLGGGTANLLSGSSLRDFLRALRQRANLSPNAEITFEGMPSLFTEKTLEIFAEEMNGFDLRISVGVQTFDRAILSVMGRVWQKGQGPARCVERAHKLGIRVSLDLIFNLPSQTQAGLRDDVHHAVELAPEHLTFFDLVIGEGVDSSWSRSAVVMAALPKSTATYERWQELVGMLADNGYRRVSRSDYVLQKADRRGEYLYEEYWKRPETHALLGLGFEAMTTAFRTDLRSGIKLVNHRVPSLYCAAVEEGRPPTAGRFDYDSVDVLLFYVTSQLERESLSRPDCLSKFGIDLEADFAHEIEIVISEGLAKISKDELRLTARGAFFVDCIQALFCRTRVAQLKQLESSR